MDSGWLSLGRVPLVATWVDLPRAPPRPPPRSVALPRPRPPSEAIRPPRACLAAPAGADSPVVVVKVSFFAFGRARSFFCFETSPHCEIAPIKE